MRHAKSSWSNAQMTDYERPLNKRGLRVAPEIGKFIYEQGLTPDLIVSSSAVRAKMTAQFFLKNCQGIEDDQLHLTREFYHAPASVYLKFLTTFSNPSIDTLMFVGHNPGLEELVERLCGKWETLPTAAIAHFELEPDQWCDVNASGSTVLSNLWRPKEIGII